MRSARIGSERRILRIKGLVWLGTRSEQFTEMRDFFSLVTGLEPRTDQPGFSVFDLASGDRLEVFGAPEHRKGYMVAPVAGVLVDGVAATRSELEGRRIEFLEPVEHAHDGNAWSHSRAPDGHVYELTAQPDHPSHGTWGSSVRARAARASSGLGATSGEP